MPRRTVAEVLTRSRRRCCLCFALQQDEKQKKGQIAHLDHDPANHLPENLAFLCLDHHDEYDSRTSQSKGFTMEEARRHREELFAWLLRSYPPSDHDILTMLSAALDRPAFRTPFRGESSLPRFRDAIAETIQAINTGHTPQGTILPSKFHIRDSKVRQKLDAVVEGLVSLRAAFDGLLRSAAIRHCGCSQQDCSVDFFSDRASLEMDRRREAVLRMVHALNPSFPKHLYDLR